MYLHVLITTPDNRWRGVRGSPMSTVNTSEVHQRHSQLMKSLTSRGSSKVQPHRNDQPITQSLYLDPPSSSSLVRDKVQGGIEDERSAVTRMSYFVPVLSGLWSGCGEQARFVFLHVVINKIPGWKRRSIMLRINKLD